ncbi:putative tRNA pseudouridine synthase A, mitochondrial isoform X2 [Penaeus vannamei]|uniref:Pseudouridylate synthase 1 homolog n=1 Tax=Penaeus vannamei TaxID=6689 RepID=A0A423SLE4_PENVA|nr:putative tRNA pseudouridine synthase A, mitochondrial isoform X2 [Penaeus vannamei]
MGLKRPAESEMTESEVKKIHLNPVPQTELETGGDTVRRKRRKNPGYRTIEDDLLNAMLHADLVTEEGCTCPQLFNFQRAARTDKGVSAARQVVSIKLPEDVPDMVTEINKHLNSQIRVMAIKRTTKSFNCKAWCDSRTYSYMCPTFAFAPVEKLTNADYRISPEVLEELRSTLKIYKGTHNFHNFTARKKASDASANRYIMEVECRDPFEREGLEWVVIKIKGYEGSCNYPPLTTSRSSLHPSTVASCTLTSLAHSALATVTHGHWMRDGSEDHEWSKLWASNRDIVAHTHSRDVHQGSPLSHPPVTATLINLTARQSFMLHQIRKMIGLVMAICRGLASKDVITKAWMKDRVDLPIAPGLGLVLEEPHYDKYNKKYGSDGIHVPLDWSEVSEKIQAFREKFIDSTIVATEIEEQSMLKWLATLPFHTYDVREVPTDGEPVQPMSGVRSAIGRASVKLANYRADYDGRGSEDEAEDEDEGDLDQYRVKPASLSAEAGEASNGQDCNSAENGVSNNGTEENIQEEKGNDDKNSEEV